MALKLEQLRNPILTPYGHGLGVRDAAIVCHEGMLHCFYTASYWNGETFISYIDAVRSEDLVGWTPPQRLWEGPPVFWSVGNVLRVGSEWVLCVQDYPVRPGEKFAGDDCRLWLARSDDLMTWKPPEPMNPPGARLEWTDPRRQIDPFLVAHDGRFWCLYKAGTPYADGSLALLVSDDLRTWQEASPARPVLGAADTPDGSPVENPSVVREGGEFVLFFPPCRDQRGIGTARSDDMAHWHDVRYLDFPAAAWIPGGPNAPMVIDARDECGRWLMVLHADRDKIQPMSGVLGLAWSEDLEHWTCP